MGRLLTDIVVVVDVVVHPAILPICNIALLSLGKTHQMSLRIRKPFGRHGKRKTPVSAHALAQCGQSLRWPQEAVTVIDSNEEINQPLQIIPGLSESSLLTRSGVKLYRWPLNLRADKIINLRFYSLSCKDAYICIYEQFNTFIYALHLLSYQRAQQISVPPVRPSVCQSLTLRKIQFLGQF